MAPEVIIVQHDRQQSYDCKSDVWSIGITAIEVADKNPPLSDIHPMQALLLIPTAQLGLAKPSAWTKRFQDMIADCLIVDPNARPSAARLLEHPFFSKRATKENIIELFARAKAKRTGSAYVPRDGLKTREREKKQIAHAVEEDQSKLDIWETAMEEEGKVVLEDGAIAEDARSKEQPKVKPSSMYKHF